MKSKERVYNFIISYTEEHLYSPSIRDICEGTGLKSTSTVFSHLRTLQNEGKLTSEGVRRITLRGFKFERDRQANL